MSSAATPVNVVTGTAIDGQLVLTAPPQVAGSAQGDILVGTGGGRFTQVNVGSDGRHLVADSTQPSGVSWVVQVPDPPAGPAGGDLLGSYPNPQVFSATTGRAGIVQLAGDMGGVSTAPTVTGTHLVSPLPVAQGGTASAVQNFVDLTTAQSVGGTKNFTGNVTVSQSPVGSMDVANKAYADSIAAGISVKAAVAAATTAALPTNTYNNGASGVGATLTATAVGTLTIDGHPVVLNDRVLVKNEAATANNGIYLCTTAGTAGAAYVLTRSTDMNSPSQIVGAFTFVSTGTVNMGTGWVVTSTGPYTIGTTSIVFSQFSGAGTITAGTGLTLTGSTMSLTVPVSAGNLPSAATSALGVVQLAGDLAGTATVPAVAKVAGTAVSGTPGYGKVLSADTSSAASWQVMPGFTGSTGMLYGGIMSINGSDATKFDITQAVGYIADYVTVPTAPTLVKVTVPAQTVTQSGAALTSQLTWWWADSTGTINNQATAPTEDDRRTKLQLGVTFALTPGSTLTTAASVPTVLNQPLNQLVDLMNALGTFSSSGNLITANGANLMINKSAGTFFAPGFGYGMDPNDPHGAEPPAETPCSFRYATQAANSFGSLTSLIDVNHYDVGGTVTVTPGGQFTIHRVYLSATEVVGHQMSIQYGQTLYNSITNAVAAVGKSPFVVSPSLTTNISLIAWVVVQQGATSLLDPNKASIIQAGRFAAP